MISQEERPGPKEGKGKGQPGEAVNSRLVCLCQVGEWHGTPQGLGAVHAKALGWERRGGCWRNPHEKRWWPAEVAEPMQGGRVRKSLGCGDRLAVGCEAWATEGPWLIALVGGGRSVRHEAAPRSCFSKRLWLWSRHSESGWTVTAMGFKGLLGWL